MRIFLAAALCVFVTACQTASVAQGTRAEINPNALRAHIEFLADDLLEGRESGTRGYDIAAHYVASEFSQHGIAPAGTGGTYYQQVPIVRSVLQPGSVSLRVTAAGRTQTFTDADHVVSYPNENEEAQDISADIVFAGHGIVAPEFNRDDYAGLDVRGKFVFILGGPAPGLPGEAAAYLADTRVQMSRAAERGAIGAIIAYTPTLEARFPFARMAAVTRFPRLRWRDASVRQELQPIRTYAFTDETASAALFAGAPQSYAQVLAEVSAGRQVRGFPLRVRVNFRQRVALSRVETANVAAIIPGSDTALANEVIVVTSHLDHVGIGEPVNGDRIYNGALDNASGIASMLEVARVLSRAPLKRSVLFIAVAAEEKGLIGSDYFAHAPTIAKDRIVGVINIDGVLPIYNFTSVIGYGMDSSTLREPLDRAVRSMGVALMPDPNPELSIFARSDHFSFVKQGVPGIFLLMGDGVGPDGRSGLVLSNEWSEAHLHQPSDDLSRPLDYAIYARFTEVFRRFIQEAADMPQRPRWYQGDFFGDRFAPDAPRATR